MKRKIFLLVALMPCVWLDAVKKSNQNSYLSEQKSNQSESKNSYKRIIRKYLAKRQKKIKKWSQEPVFQQMIRGSQQMQIVTM